MNHVIFLRFLNRGNKQLFDVGYSPQKTFLDKFPEPRCDKDRSFFQYKCQRFFSPKWKEILLDLVAFLAFIPVLLFLWVRYLFIKFKEHHEAICDLEGMKEVIPEPLTKGQDLYFCGLNVIGCLDAKSVYYVLSLFIRNITSPYFSLKSTIKVGQFCQLMKMYLPHQIIVHSEYSFTSSILTDYCHRNGVSQINVMHGEKLFNIGDAFFHYSECYVWDDYYKELFCSLRAEPNQFKVYRPGSLTIDTEKNKSEKAWADYKYYLGPFNDEQIQSIIKSMGFVKAEGKTIKYRFHPRFSGQSILSKYVDNTEIEDPKEVSILESLSSCDTAVGSYSTALSQAFYSGKNVLLDDVTYNKEYKELKELKYWLIDKGCATISNKIMSLSNSNL